MTLTCEPLTTPGEPNVTTDHETTSYSRRLFDVEGGGSITWIPCADGLIVNVTGRNLHTGAKESRTWFLDPESAMYAKQALADGGLIVNVTGRDLHTGANESVTWFFDPKSAMHFRQALSRV